jgi:hypothetical protein
LAGNTYISIVEAKDGCCACTANGAAIPIKMNIVFFIASYAPKVQLAGQHSAGRKLEIWWSSTR